MYFLDLCLELYKFSKFGENRCKFGSSEYVNQMRMTTTSKSFPFHHPHPPRCQPFSLSFLVNLIVCGSFSVSFFFFSWQLPISSLLIFFAHPVHRNKKLHLCLELLDSATYKVKNGPKFQLFFGTDPCTYLLEPVVLGGKRFTTYLFVLVILMLWSHLNRISSKSLALLRRIMILRKEDNAPVLYPIIIPTDPAISSPKIHGGIDCRGGLWVVLSGRYSKYLGRTVLWAFVR